MTILPKKNKTKEKNEGEGGGEQMAHSSSSVDHRGTRRTTSSPPPARWVPPSSREERLANHDPGGGGGRESHEGSSSHKRRHRSSPHRSVRKHRGGHDRPSERSSPPLVVPRAPNPQAPSSATKPMELGEMEELNSGYNSGDEYSMNTGSSNGSTCDDKVWVMTCHCWQLVFVISNCND